MLFEFVAFLVAVGLTIFIGICVGLKLFSRPSPQIIRSFNELRFFTNNKHEAYHMFPTLAVVEQPLVNLTVILPAYNEQIRLPPYLTKVFNILSARADSNSSFTYEIIIVDDGSTDETTTIGLDFSSRFGCENIRVLTLAPNRGKGGAVRMGFLASRGKHILFADADGATEFNDLPKLEKEISKISMNPETDCAIVCGSRAHLEKDAIASRSFFRTILMKGFQMLVWFLCVRGVKDTQCGFKLFTRKAAAVIAYNLHVERWAFDVELLYIAQYLSIPVGEVAVNWKEIEGSKLVPFWSWLQMGRDLMLIRLRYLLSAWTITPDVDEAAKLALDSDFVSLKQNIGDKKGL